MVDKTHFRYHEQTNLYSKYDRTKHEQLKFIIA